MMRIGIREIMIMWIPKMMIMAVSRDDLFLWQAEILSATGAVSHVQFSPTWTKMVMIMMTKMMTMTITTIITIMTMMMMKINLLTN